MQALSQGCSAPNVDVLREADTPANPCPSRISSQVSEMGIVSLQHP